MKLRVLLEKTVKRFSRPKRSLEQYRTPPEIAVEMATVAKSLGCYNGVIADYGSGTGMITYALAATGARYVVGIEVDEDAVNDATSSELYTILPTVDFIVADATQPPLRKADCIVENPPFGISGKRGMDRAFVASALLLKPRALVTLHHADKGTLRVVTLTCREAGFDIKYLNEEEFPIPQTFPNHWKRIHYIRVLVIGCIRVNP